MDNLIAVMATNCDPALEDCSTADIATSEQLVRPPIDGFASLMVGFVLQPIASLATLFISALFFPDADVGYEMLFYLFIPLGLAYYYQIPFWLGVVYLVFGSNFFLFSWVDNVLIFLIKHFVSNTVFLMFLMQFFNFYVSYDSRDQFLMGFSEFHVMALVLGLLTTGFFWNRTMYDSVGAIRYMDPSWNEVPDGERLWPSLFYLFGLVDKN